MQTAALNDEPTALRSADWYTHSPQRRKRCQGILAFEETLDLGRTLGQGRQHHSAVRDRFIARHAQIARQVPTGLDAKLNVTFAGSRQDTPLCNLRRNAAQMPPHTKVIGRR